MGTNSLTVHKVYGWLAEFITKKFPEEKYALTPAHIESLHTSSRAVLYLLVWPLFEVTCFSGFMEESKIRDYCREVDQRFNYGKYEEAFSRFFSRYQDTTRYNHLKHKSDRSNYFSNMLKRSQEDITSREKMEFLMFVVFRYRNNIFHGNKKIMSWAQYEPQIDLCLEVMMNIMDDFQEHQT